MRTPIRTTIPRRAAQLLMLPAIALALTTLPGCLAAAAGVGAGAGYAYSQSEKSDPDYDNNDDYVEVNPDEDY